MKYLVKAGYCLHLPHGRFAHPGEEVELSGELEQQVLEGQGWKVELVAEPAKTQEGPERETKEISEPPLDRAVKAAKRVKIK